MDFAQDRFESLLEYTTTPHSPCVYLKTSPLTLLTYLYSNTISIYIYIVLYYIL